jgi:CDP-glycerol glycerophosphotransferase (TagB/SpsB family)
MVKIATYLSKEFPERTIIFKLHPGEVPFKERYEELEQYENIKIKTYDNIYELIASTKIIVGYYSTTLFEAMAYSSKRIFVFQNDLIPDSIGYKFSECKELRDAILNTKLGYSTADSSYFWEPDWESRIAEFLDGLSQK